MPDRDYYEVLGVPRDANSEAIKKAYRAQARKYHPDVNPGDKTAEAKFKEAQKAYDILSDLEKKSMYDRYGSAAFEGFAAPGPRAGAGASEWAARPAEPGSGAGAGFESFDFSQFFGSGAPTFQHGPEEEEGGGLFEDLISRVRGGKGARPSASPRPSRSMEAQLTIPFLTAIRGGETTIEIQRDEGRRESLVVKIPPGLDSGAKLRLKGQGDPARKGTPRGDLTIQITVEPHPYFHREGRDLSVEVPVTIGEALLGAKVDVPTLAGLKSMAIPPGSSSGAKLRLRGQGVPASGAKPQGDLLVVLKIVAPKSLDEVSQRLIREFAERNPQDPRAGLWS